MSHPSWFTLKVKLLGLCPKCNVMRLREEREPIPLQSDESPKEEKVRIICPHCGAVKELKKRKIQKSYSS